MKTNTQITQAFVILLSLVSTSVFGQWISKGSVGGGKTRGAFCFVIGTKAYIGGGDRGGAIGSTNFWEWDQGSDTWTQKANAVFGWQAAGFSIGTKGYMVAGDVGCVLMSPNPCNIGTRQLREYDPATNYWVSKSNIGGPLREQTVAFAIGNYGYVTTGTDKYECPASTNTSQKDLWQWEQATDTWTQMANLPGNSRFGASGFVIGTKGYVVAGTDENGMYFNDLWEWDQATNAWTAKANFPGTARSYAASFSIGNSGYIGTGVDKAGNNLNDFWRWDQASNSWVSQPNFGGKARYHAVGFAIGTKGYIGTGDSGVICYDSQKVEEDDLWEFTDCGFMGAITADPSTTVCVGQSVYLHASGGGTYQWNTGQTTANVMQNPMVTTTYSVTISDTSGCGGMVTFTVFVDTTCVATAVQDIYSALPNITVAPNPFIESATVTIQGEGVEGITRMKILDIAGREVRNFEFSGNRTTILRDGLKEGIYFYKADLPNNVVSSGKFMISNN